MNNKLNNPKFLKASTAAAFSSILVPLALGLYVLLGGASTLADGTIDNAPYRAAIVLLFSTPILLLFLLASWYIITKFLYYCKVLTRKSLLLCCAGISIINGSIFAVIGYNAFGLKDAIISFATYSMFMFASLVLGWLVWWPIGFAGHNNDLNQTN